MDFIATGLPDSIALIEGETENVTLAITGVTGSYTVTYGYTTEGGTASSSDFSGSSGSYSFAVTSTSSSTRYYDMDIRAYEDGISEEPKRCISRYG